MIQFLTALILAGATPSSPPDDPGAVAPDSAGEPTMLVRKLGALDQRLRYPTLEVSMTVPLPAEGLPLGGSPLKAVELSRFETTLKGAHLGFSSAALLGAMGASYDLWDEKKTWWLVGGAAAAGALYGGTLGHDNVSFRVETRWEED